MAEDKEYIIEGIRYTVEHGEFDIIDPICGVPNTFYRRILQDGKVVAHDGAFLDDDELMCFIMDIHTDENEEYSFGADIIADLTGYLTECGLDQDEIDYILAETN